MGSIDKANISTTGGGFFDGSRASSARSASASKDSFFQISKHGSGNQKGLGKSGGTPQFDSFLDSNEKEAEPKSGSKGSDLAEGGLFAQGETIPKQGIESDQDPAAITLPWFAWPEGLPQEPLATGELGSAKQAVEGGEKEGAAPLAGLYRPIWRGTGDQEGENGLGSAGFAASLPNDGLVAFDQGRLTQSSDGNQTLFEGGTTGAMHRRVSHDAPPLMQALNPTVNRLSESAIEMSFPIEGNAPVTGDQSKAVADPYTSESVGISRLGTDVAVALQTPSDQDGRTGRMRNTPSGGAHAREELPFRVVSANRLPEGLPKDDAGTSKESPEKKQGAEAETVGFAGVESRLNFRSSSTETTTFSSENNGAGHISNAVAGQRGDLSASHLGEIDASKATNRTEQVSALFQQITDAIQKMRTNTRTNVEVQVQLQDGQQLVVKLNLTNGQVRATFQTESRELRQALEQHWGQFTAQSVEKGIRVAPPQFEGNSGGAGDYDQRHASDQRHQGAERDASDAQQFLGSLGKLKGANGVDGKTGDLKQTGSSDLQGGERTQPASYGSAGIAPGLRVYA